MLFLDIETRSRAKLDEVGAVAYALDPSTEVLCIAWCADRKVVHIWDVQAGEPVPKALLRAWRTPWRQVQAMGEFDELVLRTVGPRIGLDHIEPARWLDMSARARSAGCPGGLDRLCKFLSIPQDDAKQARAGKDLIRFFCVPRKDGTFNEPAEHPEKWAAFKDYNRHDVLPMLHIDRTLPLMTVAELELARATQRMNQRGLPLQAALVKAVDQRQALLVENARQLCEVVAPGINPASPVAVKAWLQPRIGREIGSLTEAGELMVDPGIGQEVVDFLQLREVIVAKAGRKAQAMLAQGIPDGPDVLRAYSQFLYCGAEVTGRFSGRGIQPQNFARPQQGHGAEVIEQYLHSLDAGTRALPRDVAEFRAEMALLGSAMRGLIWHPVRIASSDFSAIELRLLAVVADACLRLNGGVPGADADLVAALASGQDLYSQLGSVAAARLGVTGITPENAKATGWRQVGKGLLLGLGYRLGPQELVATLALPGRSISFADAQQLVTLYRERYTQVPLLWRWLESAFRQVVTHGGRVALPGVMYYSRAPDGCIELTRVSGASLRYYEPALTTEHGTYGPRQVISVLVLDKGGNPVRKAVHGGVLTAHLVQSMARDLMGNALLNAERAGLQVVGTVHDELLVIGGKAQADLLHGCMLALPPWAEGWPIAAETEHRARWGK